MLAKKREMATVGLQNAEDLRKKAQSQVQQWDKISFSRGAGDSRVPQDAANVEMSAKYSTSHSTFLVFFEFRALRNQSKIEMSLMVGYEYGQEISADHQESIKFAAHSIGPMAFAMINQALGEIAARTGENPIQLTAKDQLSFWEGFEQADPLSIKFNATPIAGVETENELGSIS